MNLGWTKVYSPIDGIAGVSNSQVGDLVGTATKMTTVSQVNPIWAYFNISESKFLQVAPQISNIIMGKVPSASAVNNVGGVHPGQQRTLSREGKLHLRQSPDRHADRHHPDGRSSSRTLTRCFAPAASAACASRPGTGQSALLVPQAAVIEVQSLYQVIVLNPENKAVFRPVKVGERVGPNWIITEGLKPGEKVVVEGILKVQQFAAAAPEFAKTGIPVVPKPYVPPARSGREQLTMSKFFINRPIVAIVISILMVLVGVVAILEPADRAVPQYCRPDDPGEGDVSRRRRRRPSPSPWPRRSSSRCRASAA